MSALLLNLAIYAAGFGCGLSAGYLLFRSERAYQQGWSDGVQHERLEVFRRQLKERVRHLINPETGDFYDK